MTYFSAEYLSYMRSNAWQLKRLKKLNQIGHRCEGCGTYRGRGIWLEVHHKTYKRLGREWLSDLQVLCNGPNSRHCHDRATKRMRRNRKIKKLIFG